MDDVISQLVTFHSLLHIRNIQIRKEEDAKKVEEAIKLGKPLPELEIEEPVIPQPEPVTKGKKKNQVVEEITEEHLQYLREQAAKEAEIKRYGRTWVWDGYINDKNKDKWLLSAQALRHINDQVL
jgi:hypothetical protein